MSILRDSVADYIIGQRMLQKPENGFGIWLLIRPYNSFHQVSEPAVGRPYSFYCHVAEAPGGAYQQFGQIELSDEGGSVRLKTVRSIMAHRSVFEDYVFIACEPGYPDNLLAFVEDAARNACGVFRLSHKRAWARHGRVRKQCRVR